MMILGSLYVVFFFNTTATSEIYTLSLHDALPICRDEDIFRRSKWRNGNAKTDDPSVHNNGGVLVQRIPVRPRSEEHTSELQSHSDLVCRLLLEKKKKKTHCEFGHDAQHGANPPGL